MSKNNKINDIGVLKRTNELLNGVELKVPMVRRILILIGNWKMLYYGAQNRQILLTGNGSTSKINFWIIPTAI